MVDKQDILNIKKNIHDSEKKINEIGEEQFPYVIKLSEWLLEIMEGIDSIQLRGKRAENAAVITRMKVAKQGIKLSKQVKNFEKKVVEEFSKDHISEEIGKKFGNILNLMKAKGFSTSCEEIKFFRDLVKLDKSYKKYKQDLEYIEENLRKDKNRMSKILEELDELENCKIDSEKVEKYSKILSNLGRIKEFRKDYINSLISDPVLQLLASVKDNSLIEFNFPKIQRDNLESLIEFFSKNSEFNNYNLAKLSELFDYNEKKLSHVYPETSKFKRIVVSKREWFESILNVERTNFLLFDLSNQRIVNFYSNNSKGAKEIIENLLKEKENMAVYKQEYEKNERFKEKTKKLSKYSKTELEKEIQELDSNLETLQTKQVLEEKPPKETKKEGLFSRFLSFFR